MGNVSTGRIREIRAPVARKSRQEGVKPHRRSAERFPATDDKVAGASLPMSDIPADPIVLPASAVSLVPSLPCSAKVETSAHVKPSPDRVSSGIHGSSRYPAHFVPPSS